MLGKPAELVVQLLRQLDLLKSFGVHLGHCYFASGWTAEVVDDTKA